MDKYANEILLNLLFVTKLFLSSNFCHNDTKLKYKDYINMYFSILY